MLDSSERFSPSDEADTAGEYYLKLFYYKSAVGNFGDDLNEWLWSRFIPQGWSDDSKVLFSGIGTIIGNPMPPADRVVIFSSGVGYSPVPIDFHGPRFDVRAVRGPLSAKILGLDNSKVVADGALLLSQLPEFAPLPEAQRSGVLFVPHYEALENPVWKDIAIASGVELLDPRSESRMVVSKIRAAKLVIADSMHAAIVADTMRVPWVPVATSYASNTFKWLDWSMALQIKYNPTLLPAPTLALDHNNRIQQVSDEAFYVPSLELDEVIERFRRIVAKRADPKSWVYRQRKKRLLGLPSRLLSGVVKTYGGSIDRKYSQRTVDTLIELSKSHGYLSEERIINEKTSVLMELLSEVGKEMRPNS